MRDSATIEQRLTRIERKLDSILRDKRKENPLELWIPEQEAAHILNLQPRYLRRKAKDGKIPVQYKDRNGRAFRYNKNDLVKYLLTN